MGDDEMAVVDDRLSLYGIEGLRVVDASVMPTIPRANTHSSTMMIAERAWEFITTDD
jgi:choline dehydrogenase